MPEKDMTRLTVEKASEVIGRLRGHFATKVPYGPKMEKLTNREARLKIQNMDILSRQELEKNMGPVEWDAYMEKLYGRN
ncbi:hypothetical protein CMI37_34770 [Candidatus Pacearchaeota archaeon]|nr:hypothetical protein [Candidatus Pacearchaeota archaeon]|tara:strand:+ start:878 stop:1114 length:237 start_codon:yes stop_codon:yes gene_type:complete